MPEVGSRRRSPNQLIRHGTATADPRRIHRGDQRKIRHVEEEKPHRPRLEKRQEIFRRRTQGRIRNNKAHHERIMFNRKIHRQEGQHGRQNP